MPAALHIEREGTVANSGRWISGVIKHRNHREMPNLIFGLWISFIKIRKAYEADPGLLPIPFKTKLGLR